jgi:hypothetical protein
VFSRKLSILLLKSIYIYIIYIYVYTCIHILKTRMYAYVFSRKLLSILLLKSIYIYSYVHVYIPWKHLCIHTYRYIRVFKKVVNTLAEKQPKWLKIVIMVLTLGVDIIITIFCDFRQFSAKNWGFYQKPMLWWNFCMHR